MASLNDIAQFSLSSEFERKLQHPNKQQRKAKPVPEGWEAYPHPKELDADGLALLRQKGKRTPIGHALLFKLLGNGSFGIVYRVQM